MRYKVARDLVYEFFFFFSSRRRHTRLQGDWSSDVCSSDLCGSPTSMSSPTWVGVPQFRCAVPSGELPLGWQWTASCWALGLVKAVLPLLKTTTRSPFGSTFGSDPWSKSQAPAWGMGQSVKLLPLIAAGVDQVRPWSVDMEPYIGEA